MHHFARRTAGYTTALMAAALLLTTGCGDDDDDSNSAASTTAPAAATTTTVRATTTSSEISETARSAESATATTGPDSTGESTEQTKIPTQGGTEVTVSGDIYEKYVAAGGPTGPLGAPMQAQENGPDDGEYQDFVGGTIYEANEGDPHIVWGEIRTAWEGTGGANGTLGYPTSDETDIPGGKQSTFTGGTITWVDGQITVTPK
ncbi:MULTISPECIES: LGFP repeat-containing protein [Nocardia]|uniref:LGFP repeat-containing protein n=1 Tax=Nocardia TaxID=1817 RepID=UPI000D691851|nr:MULTISPECIES: esterase [Nocardia]